MTSHKYLLLLAAALLPVAATAQQAAPRAAQVLDKPPTESLPALKQVEALERQGKLAEAQIALEQVRAANPTRVEPLIYIGQRLYERGPEQARPWFAQVISADPGNVYATAYLARIDAQAGKFDAARSRLQRADVAHPDSLEIQLAHADVATKQKNGALTLMFLGEARKLARPGAEVAQVENRYADIYYTLNHWQDAEAALTRVLAIAPHPHRLLQRGDARAQLGKYTEALADYDAAAKTPQGKEPGFKAALEQRATLVKAAANKPFAIDPANKLHYYALVSLDDYAKPFAATATYHCNAGAYVIAIAEIKKQSVGEMSAAPIHKVGSPGKVGSALLAPDLIDPMKLSLFNATIDRPEDKAAIKGRDRLKFCP